MNNQGVHHEIIFNKVGEHPMIISEWPFLEEYYSLPCEVVVEFGYYGNDMFGIHGFKVVFHENIYTFDVILTAMSVSHSKLVEYCSC